jgi:hypothetical protein
MLTFILFYSLIIKMSVCNMSYPLHVRHGYGAGASVPVAGGPPLLLITVDHHQPLAAPERQVVRVLKPHYYTIYQYGRQCQKNIANFLLHTYIHTTHALSFIYLRC